jgi:2-keto-4-pentenoate hydratase/2-oxohepta-3-ene-1,7-dioic acid hydratase in catechol pathway
MRIVRVDVSGETHWGVLRDEAVELLTAPPFEAIVPSGRTVPLTDVTLLAPTVPQKIICLGRNYGAHVTEMGYVTTELPSLFMKPPGAVIGPDDLVVLPPTWLSTHVEHEAELAIVIGRGGRFIEEADALDAVLGFTCADDVSARDLQKSDPHPTRGKGFDTFCPVGPWIETDVSLDDGLAIRCRVNGDLRQDGSTSQMIFKVPFLVSYISQYTTLVPGDLILTGSPGGTLPLRDGDVVEIEIEGVGLLRHGVRDAE